MQTIQGIQMSEFGEPEILVLRKLERPQVKAGEVSIKREYTDVSLAGTYMRRDNYRPSHTYATRLPFTPGVDGVGRIAEIGAGVSGFSADDHVTYVLSQSGYAQYVAVPS